MAADGHRQPPLRVEVVMVPLPAQGHLNQLLHLSRLIAGAYSIPVHYVSTAAHLRQAKLRLHGWDPTPAAATNLHFHEFPIPKFESPIPDPTNAANKFPSHLQPLFQAAAPHLRQPLAALLHRLAEISERVVVIHDLMMSSAVVDVATIPNAESYGFHAISAFCSFWYFYDSLERPFPVEEFPQAKVPSMEDCFTTEFMKLVESEQKFLGLNSGNLFNTCRVTEGPFLDLIDKLFKNEGKKSWALGPLNPVNLTGKIYKKPDGFRHECLKWLDCQEPKSVIYISFGTTVSLPEEQIKQLAIGLEESRLKFIWVLRDADRGDFELESGNGRNLLSGFVERVKERGMVVKDWAPQLEILGHVAVGGFVSHCGWNSCMESLSAGVAVATWPMHSDQPRNAVLMTEVLRVGLVARDWAERGRIVEAARVTEVVRRLMGEEGTEMRRRAEEIGGAVRDAVLKEGGDTRQEMDAFVAHIRR